MTNAERTKYKNDWQWEHADRISLNVPKGQREKIRDHAQAHGESINGFITRAISETMDRDRERDTREQLITQMADKEGKSIVEVEHAIEIIQALKILEREIPDIRELYNEEKRKKLLSDCQTTIITLSKHN